MKILYFIVNPTVLLLCDITIYLLLQELQVAQML